MSARKWCGLVAAVTVVWCGAVALARAQTEPYARWVSARPLAQLGAPSTLVLEVGVPVGASVALPTLPQDWPPFTVLSTGEVGFTEEAGLSVYRHTVVVVPWQVGDVNTPPTTITYQPVGESVARALVVVPALLTVPSVLDERPSLRPSKPLLAMRVVPMTLWVAVLSGAVVLAFGGVLGARFWGARRAQHQTSVVWVAQQALRALEDVLEMHTEHDSAAVQRVGDVLRDYVSTRAGVPTEQRTTRELVLVLREARLLMPPQLDALRAMLEAADLAKFAPETVATGARPRRVLVEQATRWVQAVEASLAQRGR